MASYLDNTMALIESAALYNGCKIVHMLIMKGWGVKKTKRFLSEKHDVFDESGHIISGVPSQTKK